MKNNAPLRHSLKNARGLGSAKSGVHHFLTERLTGLALIPLGLWFVINVLSRLLDGKVTSLVLWLESPLTATFLALFVVFSFVHSAYGIQVIIEDYVSCHKKRIALLLLNKALHILLAVITVLAVINLHFKPPVVL